MTPLEHFQTYARNRLADVRKVIETFETTSLTTGERRNGVNVDTTAETKAAFEREAAELERLIAKHG